jgi:anti-anti-sigma factor
MFERQRQGTVDVIRCDEAIVLDHIDELGELLRGCLASGQPRAVLDMRTAPLVDSSGLETLLQACEDFERVGGGLRLAAPNELCREILTCTGLLDQLDVYSDVKSAVGSFAQ